MAFHEQNQYNFLLHHLHLLIHTSLSIKVVLFLTSAHKSASMEICRPRAPTLVAAFPKLKVKERKMFQTHLSSVNYT